MFFLNWNNHVNYNLVAQTPQYKMGSIQDLQNIPINKASSGTTPAAVNGSPEILADVASIKRGHEMSVINQYNVRRVVDIYGAVQGPRSRLRQPRDR